MHDAVRVAVEHRADDLLHDARGDLLVEVVDLLDHREEVASFAVLGDEIEVLRVVEDFVYPDDVRVVDVLEDLELEEELALVLLVDLVLRDHCR